MRQPYFWLVPLIVGVLIIIGVDYQFHTQQIYRLQRYNEQLKQQVRELCAMIPSLKIGHAETAEGKKTGLHVSVETVCEPVKEDR